MSFLTALRFLTALPLPGPGELTPRRVGRAMSWFPAVGLLIGALLAAADWASRALFPPYLASALLLVTWVAITGALHLDGFLDCCDGLLVAKPPDERLAILRDPHSGSFALVGGVCLLLTKYTALMALPIERRAAILIVIPAVARAASVFAARAYPYARPGPGLGQLFREGLGWTHVAMAGFVALAAAGLALGLQGLALCAAAWLLTVAIAWWTQRRIPGLTGDVYGAIIELSEVCALLVCVAWSTWR